MVLLMVLLVGLLAVPASGSVAVAATAPDCDLRSWVGGSVDLCRGELVYSDYVTDDLGKDGDPAAKYPAGQLNSADLVRLRLQVSGSRLLVSAELNALYKADSTVLAVAIDADDDPSTGGGQWGKLNVASDGWDQIAFFDRGDPKSNVITGQMRLPKSPRWRVQAVTAIRATGEVMNVAFRGTREHAQWYAGKQTAALATGDISRFGHTVDTHAMRQGATRRQQVGPGRHERVYTSRYKIGAGEGTTTTCIPGRGNGGIFPAAAQKFCDLGVYQPFSIYVPKQRGPHGLQLTLHGSGGSFNDLFGVAQFGDRLNRVLVAPEARGPDGYGSDLSERDILDVIADVKRNYPIDPDEVIASGSSQGGYIAYRLGMLYPHVFAGVIAWSPHTGNWFNNPIHPPGPLTFTAGSVGNVIDFVGNLRSVPTVMAQGFTDFIVPPSSTMAMEEQFAASDNIYSWHMLAVGGHFTQVQLGDFAWEAAASAGWRRVTNPPRVTYRTARFLGNEDYGIRHDRAYWVSRIRPASDDRYSDVDLSTHACGGSIPTTTTGTSVDLPEGAENYPAPWLVRYRKATGSRQLPKRALLDGVLTNTASLHIDAKATCLAGRPFAYDLRSDTPVRITLSDGRAIDLPKGHSTGRLR